MNIKVWFIDGTTIDFKQERRAGGSYSNRIRFDVGFVTIIDVWDKETSYRTELIQKVEQNPMRAW